MEARIHGAPGRPLPPARERGRARVSERLGDGADGKPLVFRNTMIEHLRALVDVVPRLNLFGDAHLARLCEEVKERIAAVEPDMLRPSRSFDPGARERVKRAAVELAPQFAGVLRGGGVMGMHDESRPPGERLRRRVAHRAALLREPRAAAPAPPRPDARDAGERRARVPLLAGVGGPHGRGPHQGGGGAGGVRLCAQAPHAPRRTRPRALAAGVAARDRTGSCAGRASCCPPTRRRGRT